MFTKRKKSIPTRSLRWYTDVSDSSNRRHGGGTTDGDFDRTQVIDQLFHGMEAIRHDVQSISDRILNAEGRLTSLERCVSGIRGVTRHSSVGSNDKLKKIKRRIKVTAVLLALSIMVQLLVMFYLGSHAF